MDDRELPEAPSPRVPLHLWLVGGFLLLWNAWGVALAINAQVGRLPHMLPEHAEYFEAQPLWFVLLADVGPLAGVAGAVALLLLHKSAVWLFATQLIVVALANAYELVIGTSLLLTYPESRPGVVLLFALFAGQIAYAKWMRSRGFLT